MIYAIKIRRIDLRNKKSQKNRFGRVCDLDLSGKDVIDFSTKKGWRAYYLTNGTALLFRKEESKGRMTKGAIHLDSMNVLFEHGATFQPLDKVIDEIQNKGKK